MMHDWGMMNNWGMGGMIIQLLLWVIVIFAVIWAIKYFTGQGRNNSTTPIGESALDILKKRYANGEINKNEFEQKNKDLV